ncbi:hypothetical protein ACLB1N_19085 [Escherichia coli]
MSDERLRDIGLRRRMWSDGAVCRA